jgi:hypothetical protein
LPQFRGPVFSEWAGGEKPSTNAIYHEKMLASRIVAPVAKEE